MSPCRTFFLMSNFWQKVRHERKKFDMKVRHELFGPARQGRTNFENISLVLLQKLFKLDSKLHLSDKNFGACGGHFFTGRGRCSQLPRRAFLGRPLNYREVKRIFRHDTIVHTTQSVIIIYMDTYRTTTTSDHHQQHRPPCLRRQLLYTGNVDESHFSHFNQRHVIHRTIKKSKNNIYTFFGS